MDDDAKLREMCERSLYVFCKAVLGMRDFVPHLHRPLCNWLQTNPPRKKLLLTPRGTFKTSMARGLAMWATIQPAYRNALLPGKDGRNTRILFAAENERMALKRIGWIRRQYMKNELLRRLWPQHVWEPGEQDAETWTLSRFALPRSEDYPEATFEAAGVDSGATGGHFDIIINDDLIGQRSRKQPELMRSTVEWWDGHEYYYDDPSRSLDFVFGTRWAAEDLYSHIFEKNLDYDLRIYGATSRPDDLPPTGDPDLKLLFPERLTRFVLENKRTQNEELYWLNLENEPYKGGNTAFNMALCGWFERDGLVLNYNEVNVAELTKHIVSEATAAAEAHATHVKRKPFYRLTPEERTEAWLEMQRRWHENKMRQIETT